MSQPRRVQFIGGVPFPFVEDDRPTRLGLVDFDGGVRGDYNPPAPRAHERREGAWITVEYKDGADWLWPRLFGR